MKNLLIFLFGAAVGVGGTMLWLRKGIKKELEEIKKSKTNEEVPFVVNEEEGKTEGDKKAQVKAQYHETVNQYNTTVPMRETEEKTDSTIDPEEGFSDTDGGIVEIDCDDFMHNQDNEKVRLVYFRGDHVMCEENGTVIAAPAMLVGGNWENCVGNYADRTAFIRNSRLVTDYEIYVEDGLYVDEYGVNEDYRED